MKKIVILMLALTLVFAMSVAVSATDWYESDYDNTIAAIEDITLDQNAGWETVTVSVTLDDTWRVDCEPYALNGAITVRYPEGITVSSAEIGALGSIFNTTTINNKTSDHAIYYVAAGTDPEDIFTPEGSIITADFVVPTGAVGAYTVTVEGYFYDDEAVKHELAPVEFDIVIEAATPAANIAAVGRSLVLDGGIATKVYFTYTDAVNADALVANVNGATLPLVKDDTYACTSYCLIDNIAPKDYANAIDVVVTDGTYEGVLEDLTVADYITAAKASSDTKLSGLATALEVYCQQADIFFNNKATVAVTLKPATGKSGYNNLKLPTSIADKVVGGLTFESTSLILKNKVTLRHYFKMAAGTNIADYTITGGTVGTMGGYAYVDITNINANALDEATTVTVTKDGKTLTITFAPQDYIALVKTSDDKNLVNLTMALYSYYYKAMQYLG